MIIENIRVGKKYTTLYIVDGKTIRVLTSVFFMRTLEKGYDYSDEEIQALIEESETVRAKEYAVNLLSREPRSEFQVRMKLKAKGFSSTVCERSIGFLEENGLLDDEAYAHALVASLQSKRKSAREIEAKLRQAQVAEEYREDALAGLGDEHEEDALSYYIEMRYAHYHEREDGKGNERLIGFLIRKGFSYDAIRKQIREYEARNKGFDYDA